MKTIKLLILISLTALSLNDAWSKTRILSNHQVRNMAEVIVAKVNDKGDWLVVSAEGAFFNGRKVLFDYQVDEGGITADLNNAGDWIVASKKGAFVNGSKVVIESNIASDSAVAADINESGEWVVASSLGAFKGNRAN